jgi:nitrogen regulatory protein PII
MDFKDIRETGGGRMFSLITAVVEKGKGAYVSDAASSVGVNKCTLIKGRGAGADQTSRLFNIEIEPEREVVLILVENKVRDKIVNSIRYNLNIDKPGNGVIFVNEVGAVYGQMANEITEN